MRVWLLLLASALVATRGTVPATCSFSSLEDLNRDLNPHLEALVKRPFFNFYRISLCSQCVHKGFVPPMCGSPHCSVCECPSSDLPCDKSGRCFLDDLQGGPKDGPTEDCDSSADEESKLNLFVDPTAMRAWGKAPSEGDPWTEDQLTDPSYVDLSLNPERWTGYTALQGSDKIWEAIYKENCQKESCDPETGEFLFKAISGLHTSISTHIVGNMCTKIQKHGSCLEWGRDLEGFRKRIYDHPDRVKNIRFLFTLLLQAMKKARTSLEKVDFELEADGGDSETISNVLHLVSKASDSCELTKSPISLPPLDTTREAFRNISTIIDCVGCDKCKLWGKLQFEGIGTALRLLYYKPGRDPEGSLRRLEVIALVNTLARVSNSLLKIEEMSADCRGHIHSAMRALNVDSERLVFCFQEFLQYVYDKVQERIGAEEDLEPDSKSYSCTYGDRIRAAVAVYMTALSIVWAVFFLNVYCAS